MGITISARIQDPTVEESDEDSLFPTYLQSVGPCKKKFVALENCLKDADKNDKWAQKGYCLYKGIALLQCTNNTHSDYYEELEKLGKLSKRKK